jgi:hypothetical protein
LNYTNSVAAIISFICCQSFTAAYKFKLGQSCELRITNARLKLPYAHVAKIVVCSLLQDFLEAQSVALSLHPQQICQCVSTHAHTHTHTFEYGDLVHSPITIYSTPALSLSELQNKLQATIQLAKLDKTNLKIVSGRYKNKSTYPACKSLVYKSDLYTPMCLELFLSPQQGLSLSWLWYHIFRRGLSKCY